jgi:hypothetical protein
MLFGITGRAGNGKSTVGSQLLQSATEEGYPAITYDIGDKVLKFCIAQGLVEGRCRQSLNAKELAVLVKVGKDMRHNFGEDFCIEPLRQDYLDLEEQVSNLAAVIPNVRYANEARMVRELGGKIIRVVALNDDGSPYLHPDRDPNHTSETGLLNEPADYYITARRGDRDLVLAYAAAILQQAMKGNKASVTV